MWKSVSFISSGHNFVAKTIGIFEDKNNSRDILLALRASTTPVGYVL